MPLGHYFGASYAELLQSFPEEDVLCLDNFVRRAFTDLSGTQMSLDELDNDYSRTASNAMRGCFAVTQLLVARSKPRCLVLTNLDNIRWLRQNGLLSGIPPCGKAYLESQEGDSCALLGEPLRIQGWDFPVYFFPHPSALGPRVKTHYAPGSLCRKKYERAIGLISGSS